MKSILKIGGSSPLHSSTVSTIDLRWYCKLKFVGRPWAFRNVVCGNRVHLRREVTIPCTSNEMYDVALVSSKFLRGWCRHCPFRKAQRWKHRGYINTSRMLPRSAAIKWVHWCPSEIVEMCTVKRKPMVEGASVQLPAQCPSCLSHQSTCHTNEKGSLIANV